MTVTGHRTTAWAEARALAHGAAVPVPADEVALDDACGAVVAADVLARGDLPGADTAAMDGWAVRGPAPWRVVGEVLAGAVPGPLDDGQAVTIATGAVLPLGADGVLRREWGSVDGARLAAAPDAPEEVRSPGPVGIDVRRAGEECEAGDVVLPAGSPVTPAAVGLLAAAGLDEVLVRRVRADVLVLGDELVRHGPGGPGRPRDALGPLLGAWLGELGVTAWPPRAVPDDAAALAEALAASSGDVVVTTGSTARGPVDHLHAVLTAAGARWVVDGVAVRPGHPQVLALLPGRPARRGPAGEPAGGGVRRPDAAGAGDRRAARIAAAAARPVRAGRAGAGGGRRDPAGAGARRAPDAVRRPGDAARPGDGGRRGGDPARRSIKKPNGRLPVPPRHPSLTSTYAVIMHAMYG